MQNIHDDWPTATLLWSKGKQIYLIPKEFFSIIQKELNHETWRPHWNHTDYKMAEAAYVCIACQGENAQCPAHQKDAK